MHVPIPADVVNQQIPAHVDVRFRREPVVQRLDQIEHLSAVNVRFSHGSPVRGGVIDRRQRVGQVRVHFILPAHIRPSKPGRSYPRSTTIATAFPPPRHSDARPRRWPRFSSAYSSVVSTREPDAPIGWPSAIAPPFTLIRDSSIFSSLLHASIWA